ncbi:Alkyl hydroperoxide reductase C [Commensalibacter sp. Nvir]|uniref:peroxiredoxin n=1 Tax=Commensalibacter sp. Nvir TaxID=3069817 RepID=UPI002D604445|nr:Alkyl hydroperoxide reductase C [Commensalibacter sp. Nvir]
MLTVGDQFPSFTLKAVAAGQTGLNDASQNEFKEISNKDDAGKWKLFFFWPMDFTFICPTEIAAFGQLMQEFESRNTAVYGISLDSEYVHLNWRLHNDLLKDLNIPMLADNKRELSSALGIIDYNSGVDLRATFIVDPSGIIRHVSVNDLSVGRNPEECLRILDALQNGGLCPCNWKKGETTL